MRASPGHRPTIFARVRTAGPGYVAVAALGGAMGLAAVDPARLLPHSLVLLGVVIVELVVAGAESAALARRVRRIDPGGALRRE